MIRGDFDINMPLSKELCEFVGAIIGDGFTNKYGRMCQIQISGDETLDKEYYLSTLKPICEKLFLITPKVFYHQGLRFNIYSKRLFEMLTLRFKIPAGVKCYTVKIPQEILNAPAPMLKATLQGMFNTDGGVGFDKRKIYSKPYVRVNYVSASPKLIEQLHVILKGHAISHSIHLRPEGRAQQIQINGETNVKLFLKSIGFSNPRHLIKINYLL